MQWLDEADVQAGSQLCLVAQHDTYSISFAWPASSTAVSAGQVTDQIKNTDCTSSIARPAASQGDVRGTSAGESSCKSSSPVDSAGSVVNEFGTSDRLVFAHNSSTADNSNQGSRDVPAGHDSRNVQSQQEDVSLPASGTKQASGVPLLVCCLLPAVSVALTLLSVHSRKD